MAKVYQMYRQIYCIAKFSNPGNHAGNILVVFPYIEVERQWNYVPLLMQLAEP
jgi:hypothetical protein